MYKVGDYVRLRRNQGIAKIDEYDEETNNYYLDKAIYDEWGDETFRLDENDIEDYDKNVREIIKDGDYVNGSKVVIINNIKHLETRKGLVFLGILEQIESIVTKEQFESMQYEVGE